MIMTVPCLRDEELEGSVEPEHMMSDDGMDGKFIEAFLMDEAARESDAARESAAESAVPDGAVVMEMPATPVTEEDVVPTDVHRIADEISMPGWRVCFSF